MFCFLNLLNINKMKSKIVYFLFALVAMMTTSCKKDLTIANGTSAEAMLLEKISRIKDTKGGLTIWSSQTCIASTKKMVVGYQIDGSFDNNPFEKVEVGDIVLEPMQATRSDITTNQYIPNKEYSQEQKKSVFGRKVSIKYRKPGTTVDLRNDMSIDSPPELDMGVPGLGSTPSFRNVPLTWNAGNASDNVHIIIAFLPESFSNANYSNYAKVIRFISVPDNGSYSIPNSQFAGIPSGAVIAIGVARGNTALAAGMATGSDRTSITAISSATLIGTMGGGGGGCGSICIEPL
jgi:hypothetical protein